MKHRSKVFVFLGIGILAIGFLALGGGYWWLARSLPALDSEVQLPALSAPVKVSIDQYGIPTIQATNKFDITRALGYVTARDRLFQMDLMRRKNAGRLAEIFGQMAIKSDTQARIYGFTQKTRRLLDKLPVLHRQYLEAYAEGVNAYLSEQHALPFEFNVLSYQPEPWLPEHSLLVVMSMFENLTAWSERSERMMSIMDSALPADVVAFLTPDNDVYTDALLNYKPSLRPAHAIPVQAMEALLNQHAVDTLALAEISIDEKLAGSNAWAVSGRKTADGRAIMANDMHLGIGVPNIWYRVQLDYPTVKAAGVNLPGTPFLIAGSNQQVAWGMTNLVGDFLDLVKLEINPDNPEQYRDGQQWQNFIERPELIQIKGESPKALIVKETRWGPVAEQALLGQPVALHWVALDESAVNVDIMELEQSDSLTQAIKIANKAGGPQLNVILADAQGHIAWTVTGKIPLRFGGDGLVSRSWADGKTGWQGYVASHQLPHIIDPPEGYVVSANERRFDANFPYVVGHQFASGYRAYRIHQRLAEASLSNESSLFDLQQDTETAFYRFYQQLALQVLSQSVLLEKPELIELRNYLTDWNGRADINSSGLPVIIAFRKELIDSVFTPFLQACKQADNTFSYSWNYIDTPLQALLTEKPAQLLPDKHFKTWDAFILQQLIASTDKILHHHVGDALSSINWGKENVVGYAHPFSKGFPVLSPLLDMPHQPLAGCGGYCVRATGVDYGASERLVVSPNHFEDGILHMPGGQSGHPLSDYYKDQQFFWLTGLPLKFSAGASEHITWLKP
jgi:penicillin amidase